MLVSTPKEIGNLLAAIRRSRHIRQQDLAARVGVSRQWLIDLERGKPTISLGLTLRACATLGFTLDLSSLDPVPARQTAIIAHGEERFWRTAQPPPAPQPAPPRRPHPPRRRSRGPRRRRRGGCGGGGAAGVAVRWSATVAVMRNVARPVEEERR